MELTTKRINGALMVELPRGVTEKLSLTEGDRLACDEVLGGLVLRPADLAVQMRAAEEIMARHHAVLKELAK